MILKLVNSIMLDDKEVIRRFLDNDNHARDLITRYMEPVFSEFRDRFGYNIEIICDKVLDEMRVYFGAADFILSGSLKALIFKVTRNRCLDFLDYLKRRPHMFKTVGYEEVKDGDIIPNPEEELIAKERNLALHMIFTGMSKRCQRVFDYIFQGELKYEEIAGAMGTNRRAINTLVSECRRRARVLKEIYKDYF